MNFYPDSLFMLLKTVVRRWLFERNNRRRFQAFPVLVPHDSLVASHFSECLSEEQRSRFSRLVHIFAAETPAPFYLAFGSLLGAVLYADRIPWDDDFDVFCFAADYRAIRQIFEKDSRFRWVDTFDRRRRWIVGSKICWSEDRIEGQEHGWPFIDIFWLSECGGWLVERSSCLTFSRRDFEEVQQLAYGSLRISVPRYYERLLERSFPEWQHWAVISVYTHITEERTVPRRLKINRRDIPAPQEVRFAKGESVPLSPAPKR